MRNLHQERVDRIRHQLAESGMDTLLVFSDENRRYLSGFTAKDDGYGESAGALLITADRLILATDARFVLQAEREAVLYEIVCYSSGLALQLADILRDIRTASLGFEAGRITYAQFKRLRENLETRAKGVDLQDADGVVNGIRMQKDTVELDAMKRSLALAEKAFEDFVAEDLTAGITEKQSAWMLEKRMREAGAEGLSFPVIAAFGDNSALPHAICGDRPLQHGASVLFDWGARLDGYCSDISRSFVFGTADDQYRHVHHTVYEARRRAIEAVKPGVNSRDVDAAARRYIDDAGYADKFSHGVGHGVGLAIHEPPRVGSMSDAVLAEGMVFTIEPGIYLSGWVGVRLEEMVVVRPDGAEILNRLDASNPEIP